MLFHNLIGYFSFLFLFSISSVSTLKGQESDSLVFAYPCKQTFEWMKKAVLLNDAGVPFVLGNDVNNSLLDHEKLSDLFVEEARNSEDCAQAMNHWLSFFRKDKLSVFSHSLIDARSKVDVSKWPRVKTDFNRFEDYLEGKDSQNIEGIWLSNDYQIGVKQIETGEYIAFVMQSRNSIWKPKQVKARFYEARKDTFKGVIYDLSFQEIKIEHIHLAEPSLLSLNDGSLWKRAGETSQIKNPILHIAYESTRFDQYPFYFNSISNEIAYLKISSFWSNYALRLTHLLNNHSDEISHAKSLIIDLRGAKGGDPAFLTYLLPLVYTQPFTYPTAELRLSEKNLAVLTSSDLSIDGRKKQRKLKRALRNGEAYFAFEKGLEKIVYEQDETVQQTAHIYLLVDEHNSGAVERFIYLASQSTKCTIIGRTTSGSLGIEHTHSVQSPDARFTLEYGLSRNRWTDNKTYDRNGMVPDVLIPKEIPHYKWLHFVLDYMKGSKR